MQYPKFFEEIETIKLQDDLANFLGAFEQGIIEFSFLDIVKSAGHSCPTVLGAYLMTLQGLKALYQGELPKRGEILVEFGQNENDGVAGVIANVITNITGATVNLGFKGLAGKFDRRNLMQFDSAIQGNVKFTRKDTNKSVDVYYDASSIAADANMHVLMQACMQGVANAQQKKEFGKLWQVRVENIAKNVEQVITVSL
ncbi:MAG: hypothetical protein GY928_27205 [Colwellia sp.]|nr:hypothetical protein [Colwellia sp.]